MTPAQAFELGWQHAAIAGAWSLGFLAYVLPLVLLGAALVHVVRRINVPHRVRVHRINRQTRRDGRGITRVRNSDGTGWTR